VSHLLLQKISLIRHKSIREYVSIYILGTLAYVLALIPKKKGKALDALVAYPPIHFAVFLSDISIPQVRINVKDIL